MTHEFIETVTDPLGNTWWDSSTGNEIGDNCNQIPATVALGGRTYDRSHPDFAQFLSGN